MRWSVFSLLPTRFANVPLRTSRKRAAFFTLQNAFDHEDQKNAGDQQNGSEEIDAKFGSAFVFGGCFHKTGLPQGGNDRFVQKQHQCTIESRFQQIEGEEYGQQHAFNDCPFHTHIQWRYQPVPQQHGDHHQNTAQCQAGNSTGQGVSALIEKGGNAGEAAGGKDIHNAADGAGAADEHFRQGHHHGDQQGSQRAIEKAADGDDHILGLILKEGGGGEDGDVQRVGNDKGDGRQHCQHTKLFHGKFHRCHLNKKCPEHRLRA